MTEEVPKCESCGMPMDTPEMHGGGDLKNKYCKFCCDEHGELKSKEDVRSGMIKFYMDTEKKTEEEAAEFVDGWMSRMPAWKG